MSERQYLIMILRIVAYTYFRFSIRYAWLQASRYLRLSEDVR